MSVVLLNIHLRTTWDPHIKEDIHKLEMVQRRAASCRFVYNNHTLLIVSLAYYDLYSGLATLEIRRKLLNYF